MKWRFGRSRWRDGRYRVLEIGFFLSCENGALREAAFGNAVEAKQSAAEGLKLVPTSQGVAVEAALALAMARDSAQAESLAQGLNKRYPLDAQMQSPMASRDSSATGARP